MVAEKSFKTLLEAMIKLQNKFKKLSKAKIKNVFFKYTLRFYLTLLTFKSLHMLTTLQI